MSTFFTHSSHMPCPECGASVAATEREGHACDPERLLDYRMFQLRNEVAEFDADLQTYLNSSHGRFAQWYARYRRLRGEPA